MCVCVWITRKCSSNFLFRIMTMSKHDLDDGEHDDVDDSITSPDCVFLTLPKQPRMIAMSKLNDSANLLLVLVVIRAHHPFFCFGALVSKHFHPFFFLFSLFNVLFCFLTIFNRTMFCKETPSYSTSFPVCLTI